MSDIGLRVARETDLPAVRALLIAAKLPVDGLEDQFGSNYVVAESGDTVIAAMGVEHYGRWGLLRSAVVAPEHRGKRLGELLTDDRIAWSQDEGLEAVYLLTTTAASFFARHGFVEVARDSAPPPILASREFASVCPSNAVCMCRNTLLP